MVKFEKYQGAGNDFIIVNEKDLIEKTVPLNISVEVSLLYNTHKMITGKTHKELSKYTHIELKEGSIV